MSSVLPDGPTTRGAATSWRVYLCLAQMIFVGPPVGRKEDDPEVLCWIQAR